VKRWTREALRGKRVTVMGLGLFGGGTAATRFLVSHGAHVIVTDQRDASTLRESIAALGDLPAGSVEYHLGGHDLADFTNVDVVVANPAVAPSSPFLQAARQAGVAITSEFELFVHLCTARDVVAITGTNGKTTTTTLIGQVLTESRPRVFVGGNLGRSLLESLSVIEPDDTVVLEVSSFQLEALDAPEGWPRVAVVTNLSPDHLDRHGTMESYGAAKRRIVERMTADCTAVLNASDPWTAPFSKATQGEVRWYSSAEPVEYRRAKRGGESWLEEHRAGRIEPLIPTSEIQVPGEFQLSNVLAAAAATRALGVSAAKFREVARNFRGVAHRLQRLEPVAGVEVFDNAVSTVPESTISALNALPGPLRWIAGGKSKQLDLEELVTVAKRQVRRVYAYGAAANELAAAATRVGLPVSTFGRLAEAFAACLGDARQGETVLYSPAFPSYDQYRNFTERGAEFLRLVEAARQGLPRGEASASGA